MFRAFLGTLVILVGLAVGTWIVLAAMALSDSFPPSKSFGQDSALAAFYLGGFLTAYVAGEVGVKLIMVGWAKRKLKA